MAEELKIPESKKPESETSKEEISEDLKELVIARLEVLSSDKRFSIGSDKKEFTKDELIEHVKKGNETGKKVVELELTFLRALKDGTLLDEILASGQ